MRVVTPKIIIIFWYQNNFRKLLFDEFSSGRQKIFFIYVRREHSVITHMSAHTFMAFCRIMLPAWAFYLLKNMFAEIFFTNFSFPLWWLHFFAVSRSCGSVARKESHWKFLINFSSKKEKHFTSTHTEELQSQMFIQHFCLETLQNFNFKLLINKIKWKLYRWKIAKCKKSFKWRQKVKFWYLKN